MTTIGIILGCTIAGVVVTVAGLTVFRDVTGITVSPLTAGVIAFGVTINAELACLYTAGIL